MTITSADQYRLAELEFDRHLEDSEVSKLSHFFAAGVYERRHTMWIGVPAASSAVILTWLLTSPFERLVVVFQRRFADCVWFGNQHLNDRRL